ncbi:MAG: hypothetical protein ACXVEF_12875 [Polyangiales bacterium]
MLRSRFAHRPTSLALLVLALGCGGGSNSATPNPGGTTDSGGTDGAIDPVDGGGDADPGWKVLGHASHGSTIAISEDDSTLVAVNHDVGTATVMSIKFEASGTAPTLTKLAEIPVGAEPVQVLIDPSCSSAFVLVRKDQKLVRIDHLKDKPAKGAEVAVGSEPTGMAMTPLGHTVWVASWMDGTVAAVDSGNMKITKTVNLSAALAASGYPGKGLDGRPALSHPRNVAITNNGDNVEDDETMYVTEFYAQQKAPLAADGSNADENKVGLLYKIHLNDLKPTTIEIPPVDVGFHDHKDGKANCYPNQLSALTIQGGFGYVVSVCASPELPSNLYTGPAFAACTADDTCPGAVAGSCASSKCKTNCAADADCGVVGGQCVANVCAPNPADIRTTTAPVVSIVDLGGSKTIAATNLAYEFDKLYVKNATPDSGRRYPLHAQDVGFVPGTVTAYFPANGADAVFRVDFNASYDASTVDGVGDKKHEFINLIPAGVDPSHLGQLPTGIAVANKVHPADASIRYAFVANDATRNVSVLDLGEGEVAGTSAGTPKTIATTAPPKDGAEADYNEGKRLFNTGLGRWSYKGQALMACQTCHLDGLTDNVVYFSGRGMRQPGSLDGLVASKDPTDIRIALHGNADELSDHEGAARSFAGGVGVIVKDQALSYDSRIPFDVLGHSGLNGSSWAAADPKNPAGLPTACTNDDWQKLGTYLRAIRSPRRPTNLDPAKVTAGKALFTEGKCQGCHSGPKWTISKVFYEPDWTGVVNKSLMTKSWGPAATAAGFPAALMPAQTPSLQMMRYAGTKPADFDTLLCVLRPVGTYGVAEPEVGILEVRSKDMVTPAMGNDPDVKGFNIPSLLNVGANAPYFHGGQARTLEAVFSDLFKGHHQALNPTFLDAADPARGEKVAQLIQFLLSIDEDTEVMATPPLGPDGGVLCAP